MTTDNPQRPTTVGKTRYYQGENQTQPLFCIEPGIPCEYAREQASELMGYARDLTLTGLLEDDQKLIWASHYLTALAKALLDDAELGMNKMSSPQRKSPWKLSFPGASSCMAER
ncbi:DUF3077 domain-containing protein [Pantoea sp. Ap-967]|uniref:DUF3077 domain-containing protein n=1 Tax=Pantoea sp. Ap-967 TaxID=2608362 RepID=UPI00141E9109|nr:DUF3077 domain-containing protein [Pantoea sp. Ap-967]NIE78512.1 DUF3077 domain-containing protein [Pantoea sp. Ap-967]